MRCIAAIDANSCDATHRRRGFRITPAEIPPPSARRPLPHIGVIPIQNRPLLARLPAQNTLLRLPISVQRFVPIEMIRAEVGDDGDIGGRLQPVKFFELKAAQFQHTPVIGLNVVNFGQQTLADVPAQPRAHSGRLEDGMDHCRRRRFAVAAGHRDDLPAVELPEQIHLARKWHIGAAGDVEKSILRRHRRVDDNQVGIAKVVFHVFTETKPIDL